MTAASPVSGRPRGFTLQTLWVATAVLSGTPLLANITQAGGLAGWERLTAGGLLAFAAWRPLDAVFLLVGLGPLVRAAMRAVGSGASPLEWMLPSVLLGVSLAVAGRRVPRGRCPTGILAAALVLSWIALASVVTTVLADTVRFESREAWRQSASAFVGHEYFADTSRWRATASGIWLAQAALLLPTVATLVVSSESRRTLTRIAVASATGVAALNVLGGIVLGLHRGAWSELLQVLRSGRFSQAFPDVNAAGSFLALAVVISGTLCASALRERQRRLALLWAGAFVVQLAGLWLTGSRVALAAAVLAGVALQAVTAWQKEVTARGLVSVGLVLVLGLVVLGASQARRLQNDAPLAWTVRVEFVRTTWRMLQDHPLWGVGAGAYRPASARYSSPALRAIYPEENAHNNFLQIAGELGPAALGAFLVLVLGPLVCAGVPLWRGALDDSARALWGGALAFVLTCTGGHPLLIPEVSVFAVACFGGLASACRSEADGGVSRARASWILLAVAAALIATVPVRVTAERRSADLEHVVVTGERWVKEDGIPTLRFRGEAAVYVIADGRASRVTVRVPEAKRRPAELTLRLEDQVANVLRLTDAEWKTIPMLVPPRGTGRFRLLRIEARALGEEGRPPLVMLRRIDHDGP